MVVQKIYFNWFFTPQNGEEYSELVIGEPKPGEQSPIVTYIKDTSYSDIARFTVSFDDGSEEDIYNINRVFYKK